MNLGIGVCLWEHHQDQGYGRIPQPPKGKQILNWEKNTIEWICLAKQCDTLIANTQEF